METIQLILSKPDRKRTPLYASRFWGSPDLPKDFEYPTYIDYDGDDYPYIFICQINLEELHAFAPDCALPEKGLLSVFAKIDHFLGYYASTDCVSEEVSSTEEVKVFYFPECKDFEQVVLYDEETDKEDCIKELQISFATGEAGNASQHQLFPAMGCSKSGKGGNKSAEGGNSKDNWGSQYQDWQALLQVASFKGKGFELDFPKSGVMNLIISPEALAKGDFSDVRGILQAF